MAGAERLPHFINIAPAIRSAELPSIRAILCISLLKRERTKPAAQILTQSSQSTQRKISVLSASLAILASGFFCHQIIDDRHDYIKHDRQRNSHKLQRHQQQNRHCQKTPANLISLPSERFEF